MGDPSDTQVAVVPEIMIDTLRDQKDFEREKLKEYTPEESLTKKRFYKFFYTNLLTAWS
jgi:hypothetical protein